MDQFTPGENDEYETDPIYVKKNTTADLLSEIKAKIKLWETGILVVSEDLGRGLNFTFSRDCKVYSVIASSEPLFSLAQIQQQAGRSSRAGDVSEIKVHTLM